MTVNYTSLLGLALPVTGTEAGAWGDVVNNYLTSYLDASVAGTQTITGSQTAVTLAVTNGATLVTVGSGATGSAQFQIITCTGNPASLLTITAPASSRQYIIINSTSTSQSVQIVGAGPTTGVTIVSGEKAHVAWNGSDFVKIATQNGNGDFVTVDTTNLEVTNIKAKDGTASMTLADSTGIITLSATAGTANGVAYLNGSRALTTGSALTFDGTNLVNTSSSVGTPEIAIANSATSAGANARLRIKTGGSGSTTYGDAYIQFTDSLNWNWSIGAGSSTSNNLTFNQYFGLTSNELMRLTSTGLGIGTNSVFGKLSLQNSTVRLEFGETSGASYIESLNNARTATAGFRIYGSEFKVFTGPAGSYGDRLTVDSSGNLGLGVTPSAWGGSYKGLQVNSTGALTSNGINATGVGHNYFFDGTNNRYLTTGSANLYLMFNNEHRWYNAPSGTANSAVVAASTSYTVVALGTTTLAEWQASFSGLSAIPTLGQVLTSLSSPVSPIPNGGLVTQNISFTQAMTLDASGNLAFRQASSTTTTIAFQNVAGTQIQRIRYDDSDGSLTVGGGTATAYPLKFFSGNSQAMTLDASGNLIVGATSATSGFRLDVVGGDFRVSDVASDDGVEIGWSTGGNQGFVQAYDRNASAFRNLNFNGAMTLDSSGNLGLGVTPSASWVGGYTAFQMQNVGRSLAASGAGSGDLTLAFNAVYDNADARWEYAYTGDPASRYSTNNGAHKWYTAPSGTAGNAISFTQAMTLDASGNLGIGETNPTTRLHTSIARAATITSAIFGTTGTGVVNDENRLVIKNINTASGQNYGVGIGGLLEASASNQASLLFYTDSGTATTERARITSGGYFKASNDGTYGSSTGAYHELKTNANTPAVIITNSITSAFTDSVVNISLGYAANTTTNYFLQAYDTSVTRFYVRTNGGIGNYQSNNVDLSDIRTKKDIAPAPSYWNKIGALEIVTYKYNDQTHDDVNVGVIAQQVESVEPVWVDADGFGETPEDGVPLKTVYTKDITFAAIKALQEAMARIEKLEAEVAALKGA